jgi:hypothetical protein
MVFNQKVFAKKPLPESLCKKTLCQKAFVKKPLQKSLCKKAFAKKQPCSMCTVSGRHGTHGTWLFC